MRGAINLNHKSKDKKIQQQLMMKMKCMKKVLLNQVKIKNQKKKGSKSSIFKS
ncbi:hypothetical protein F2Q68_00008437 [Brassica cretica]|uniref:Uncharacterized protein n=1 Tax=Brassica cretica TaxID=69181 RepID=A0A8S9KQQ8_BRACR|nr:hypothetical protein F2Q68_00008437 [Brassica cretica]